MQLLIKQRVFSWSDTYDIYDEQGNQKYFVKNEFISLGHRLHVYDAAHNEIGFIKQKLFCFLPTFEIEWNGQLMGHIEKRFALFRPQYDVDFRDGVQKVTSWDGITMYMKPAVQSSTYIKNF